MGLGGSPGSRACSLLLLSLLLSTASAIYEDQAGTFDWYKQYIGRPTSLAFIPGRERVYAATDQNLIASVQTKAGSIAWRRKYTDHDPLNKILALQKPAIVLAASKGCKYLRAWDALDGGFKWESLVFEGPATAAAHSTCDLAAVDLGSTKGQAVAVAAGDKLQVFSASKGDVLWSADLELAGQATHKQILTHGASITVVAHTPGSSDVHLLSVSAADGTHQHSHHHTSSTPLSSTAAVSGTAAAFISSDGQQICTVVPESAVAADGDSDDSGVKCQQISSVAAGVGSGGGVLQLRLLPAGPDHFSLTAGQGVSIIRVSSSGAEQAYWSPQSTAAAPAAATLTALASVSDGSLAIKLIDTESGHILSTSSIEVPAAAYQTSGLAPQISAVWLDEHKCSSSSGSGDGSGKKPQRGALPKGCQVAVLWSDDTLSFVTNNTLVWSREEALASTQSSIMIDLPAARAAAAAAQDGSSRGGLLGLLQDREKLNRWVRLQVLSVLVQFKLSHEHEKAEYYELRSALSDNNLPYRDTNGFRKLIVLLTATGKVFGLHSGDGRILWAHNSQAIAAGSSAQQQQRQQYLRVWKRFHDLTHAPQLVLISAGSDATSVKVLNGHTGEELEHLELPFGVEKVIPIHQPVHSGAADQFVTLLVEPLPADTTATDLPPTPKVHLLPHTTAAQDDVSNLSSSLFFWLQQQQPASPAEAGSEGSDQNDVITVLRGYGLEPGARPDSQAGGVLPVVPAWQVVLPGQLLGVAAKDPAEPVHSYVKVLGDRSLKYRYLNPNLVFVATGTPPGSAVGPDEATISVALINTVTGAVLHQQVHSGCAGPVYAVVSENWVVYTLRDVVNLRQQASVIELYDASHHDLSLESIILGRTQHSTTQSNYGSVELEVSTLSFYLQHFVKGLAVTQTKQGITTKQLLVQTDSDQLYALDKRFLDPRRPLRAKATPEEVEERLVPYNELVIFNTLQYVTQDKQVMNVRGVTAAGAVLESTTLVLAYGADLFYTRISPAQHFDSLQSDFSYGLLVVALIALVVGTWFASYSSQQAMLKAKWQ